MEATAQSKKASEDFERLAQEHRRALVLYCYRMLGVLSDAEDVVQETYWRAWRGFADFEGRSSVRTWLFQIATYACLDALKARKRRSLPAESLAAATPGAALLAPEPDAWISPFPDALLPQAEPDPEARYTQKESVTLAFMLVLQRLSPKQRAAFLLCEVLGWSVDEAASLLATTASSVSSLLHRARVTVRERSPKAPEPTSPEETKALLERYVRAWESGELAAFASVLHEDAVVTMPPTPSWYSGREALLAFYKPVFALSQGGVARYRLLPTAANGQPAFAVYRHAPAQGNYQPFALKALTLSRGLVLRVDVFAEPALFAHFGVPPSLPMETLPKNA